ncbi:magnesium/cobalt transporter CorA [Halomarina ordinaria]|uniref:Magnesium transport protein CorA n=1 Tax=Halomarina ordinaria TaxID=3033939 RepID=A0ABD5U9Y8_9EURY|nr:magnesium/cobalt transporter CorA [Halomarina sp. PSRA2]
MISALAYDSGAVEPRTVEGSADLSAMKAEDGTTWVDATDATETELRLVADVFGIHPLAVEDVLNNVRPKAEDFTEYTFLLVKEAELTRGDRPFDEEVRDEPLGVFIGPDWVCTLSLSPIEAVGRVWSAVTLWDERLLQRGADYTAYRVVDAVVDRYFDLLDRIETQIEHIEEAVLVSTDIETLERINAVRRDLLAFRKVTWPTREAVGSLARGDTAHVRPEMEKYFRDVSDHLVHIVDLTETYRDLTSGARDIYLNTLSQSTNEVMKRLTVVATVFLPLTFIAGVYGMNFADSRYNMPELGWTYGYPAAMLGMALVALVMFAYFREQAYL